MRLDSQQIAKEIILDTITQASPAFGGETFNPRRDMKRLSAQLDRVRNLMADGEWRTLPAIATLAGGSEASVSARLRDLRKPKYGSHTIERKYLYDGLWQYRMVKNGAGA